MKCTSKCIYFPQEPTEIISEKLVDGVRHRIVKRACAYDGTIIKNWSHKCPKKTKYRTQ